MIEIGTYSTCDKESVIALVLHCQNDGTRPLVGVEDQSDLLHIEEEYIYNGGNFWVAKENGTFFILYLALSVAISWDSLFLFS